MSEPDLLDLLMEQEVGPLPCPHIVSVGKDGTGWTHERNPKSAYYLEWVHSATYCRRSALPGHNRQPIPSMGWSQELQKDVPL